MNRHFFIFNVFFILVLALGGLFGVQSASCEVTGGPILSGPYCAAEQMAPTSPQKHDEIPAESRTVEELLLLAAAVWLFIRLAGVSLADQNRSRMNTEGVTALFIGRLRQRHHPYLSVRAP